MRISDYPNYGLVVSIAVKYQGLDEFDDLIQAGMIALWEAEKRFDPSRGLKFSTLATLVVNRALITHCNKHLGRNKKKVTQIRALNRAKKELQDATPTELSEASGLSIETVLELEHGVHTTNPDSLIIEMADPEDINKLLDCLEPDERRLVEMRYGVNSRDSLSLGEMSKMTGISSSALNYRIGEALKKIRYFHALDDVGETT